MKFVRFLLKSLMFFIILICTFIACCVVSWTLTIQTKESTTGFVIWSVKDDSVGMNDAIGYWGTTIKANYSTYKKELSKYWKPAYAKIEKDLKSLLNLCEFNWLDAKKKYETFKCVHYDNFSQFVFNTDLKNMKHIKGNSVRSKTLRRKRSNKECFFY